MLTPKLAIFRLNEKTEIAKMDFLHNSTTVLSLFMKINHFTHFINQNLNLHLLILFIFLIEKMVLELKILLLFFTKNISLVFVIEMFLCFHE